MNDFPVIPISKQSIANRRLVYGVGVNDSDYMVNPKVNGKNNICQFYAKWSGMLKRCYSDRYLKGRPTYEGCKVCEEWLTFSAFKLWMTKQDWVGKELDKDLLVQGNKIYSPRSCIFVSRRVNTLLVDCGASRGEFMIGVSIAINKYSAHCSTPEGNYRIGYFKSELEAHEAYCDIKYKLIAEVAANEGEPVKSALLRYKIPRY